MMHSINRETTLTNNQHNQLVVTRKKSEPDIILAGVFSVGWVGMVSKSDSVSLQSVLLLLLLSLSFSVSPFCLSLSLSLLYDLGYSVS